MIYLDHAAATPMDPAVFAAMQPYVVEQFFNPSATYLAAQAVHKDIDVARARVAHWLGVRPSEVIFTAGGTEANNLAIQGIMAQFPAATIVTTAIEHESVLATARRYGCHEAPVRPDGIVDVDALIRLVDDQTVLVSVMYANNEVGTVQPLRIIAQHLETIRQQRRAAGNTLPLYFHTDAAQAAAYLDMHTARLGVDMLTLNAGKMYGPKQVGALFVSSRVPLQPQVFGGGQERALRSGTENVMGVIGLATAFDLVQERRHDEVYRLRGLQDMFIRELEQMLPGVIVNGSRKMRLPNNIHITIPGADNERLLFQLDDDGILCAAGSACSASSDEPSHVLHAMGLTDADARASLRLTLGHHTTADDLRFVAQKLKQYTA